MNWLEVSFSFTALIRQINGHEFEMSLPRKSASWETHFSTTHGTLLVQCVYGIRCDLARVLHLAK